VAGAGAWEGESGGWERRKREEDEIYRIESYSQEWCIPYGTVLYEDGMVR